MLIWLLLERLQEGHPTVLGGVTGAVAGLATITPCAGYVSTSSAIFIGAIAGLVCHVALRAKSFFRFDDALDVIAVHFVGGVLGSLLLGLFGEEAINSIGADGLFYGGGVSLLGWQVVALAAVIAFSFCLTWLIAIAIEKTMGLRVDPADEGSLDRRQQGMDAYHFSRVLGLGAEAPPAADSSSGRSDRRAAADVPGADMTLMTALLDVATTRVVEFKQALVDAGASTIIVTEAHVYSGTWHEVVAQ